MKNVFAKEGCKVFKTSSFTRHESSDEHESAVNAPQLATAFNQAAEHSHSAQDNAVLKCITTVLWLASENVPLAKYDKMFSLFKELYVPGLEPLNMKNRRVGYASYYTATEILEAISAVIDNDINQRLKRSPCITLLADESTDLANKKRMTINARIIDHTNCVPETVFLSDHEYEDSSGYGLASVILQELETRRVSINKFVGFGSDGASVMSGGNKGVRGVLMEKQPHLIHIHCMAHRLALSTSLAANVVKSVKQYQEWLTSIHYYFSKSSSREQELHKIQAVLDSPTLKYKEIHAVRWLSVYQAVEAIYRTIDPLITYLHQRKAANDPKSKGLLKKMATVEFVYITYLLMDTLAIVSRLCLTFQEQDLDIAGAKLAVDRCLNDLDAYRHGTQLFPTHMEHFETDVTTDDSGRHLYKGTGHVLTVTPTNLPGVKSSFVNALISNIRKRFPQKDLVDAFFVLGMRGINMGDDQTATEFGNDEIDTILAHFGEEKTYKGNMVPPKVQRQAVTEQWSRAKQIVRSMKYPVDKFAEVWQLLATHHQAELDQLLYLAQIALTLPLHTADCERTFSQQNKILTKCRANLTSKHLDQLIRVRMYSKAGGQVDKQKVLHVWKTFKSRKLYAVKL